MQEAVVATLRNTLNPDGNARRNAETQLREWSPQPNFPQTLLQIARSGVDESVCLSAAAFFKNIVLDFWSVKTGRAQAFVLSDETKEACKALIVPAVVESGGRVRSVLAEALKMIADVDWPERWPKLMEVLMPQIQFSNFANEWRRVLGAITAVRVVLRRYQYLTTDVQNRKRWPIHRMAQVGLGPFLTMLNQLIPVHSQPSVEVQMTIVKIFWSCVQQEIPPVLYNNPSLVKPWVESLVRIVMQPIPDGMQPADETLRPQFCWWVLKKWAIKVLYRMTSRHGIPNDIQIPPENPSDDVIHYEQDAIDPRVWAAYRQSYMQKKEFAAYFERECAPMIFSATMTQLTTVVPGKIYISPRVSVNLLRITCHAVKQAGLWRALEPHIDQFLERVVFPLIMFSAPEQRQFFEEPDQFIAALNELNKLAYSSRVQAMYMLSDVVKLRKKVHLDRFMTFLSRTFNSNPPPEVKEACLACLGTVNESVLDNPQYSPILETVMEQFCFPELQGGSNPNPILEWRALWLLGRMWSIKWQRWDRVLNAAQQTVAALSSRHLPIRLMAATALPHLCHLPAVAQAVQTVLPSVMQRVVAISSQIDSDEVMAVLQALVVKFPTQMAPLALQLIPPVIKAFNRAIRDDENTEAASLAAFGALDLIVSMVDECAEHTKDQQAWYGMESILGPFVINLLQMDVEGGYFEFGLKLLVAITFEPPFPNSPGMWNVLPVTYKAWQQWAKDYMLELAEAWDNFFTNDPARCAASPEILSAACDMIKHGLGPNSDLEEREGALKMMQSMLANLRGKIDNLIPGWLGLLFINIQQQTKEENMETVLDLVAQAMLFLWYNPVSTLALLESNKVTATLLDHVLSHMDDMITVKTKKLAVLGLSSLLYLDPATQLPPSVKQRMPKLAASLLHLQMELWEQLDENRRLREAEEAGENDFDDDEQLVGAVSMPNDENVDDFADVNDLDSNRIVDVDFENQEDLDVFAGMRELDEEDLCHTLDKFDDVIFFAEGWSRLANASREFSSIVNGMSKKNKEAQTKLFKLAEENKNKPSPKK